MILELALLSVINFPSGTQHQFAETLGRNSGKPVLLFYAPVTRYKEFSADTTDASYFARVVKANTGLQQGPGLDYAFSDGMIATNLIKISPIYNGGRIIATIDAEYFQVKDGIVNVGKDASTLQLLVLKQRSWAANIDWHWMFDSYNVSLSAKNFSEKEFLKLLANAAGMRLEPTKGGFSFKLNPSEFRRRATATTAKYAPAEKVAKLDQQNKWRLEMTQFALGIASDLQVQKAFDTEDGEAAILMEGQTKQSLGSKLLKMAQDASSLIRNGGDSRSLTSLKPVSESGSGGLAFGGSPAAIAGFTETVDWRRPVTLYLRSNFRVRIIGSSLPRDPNYSGPTAPVSVDF